MQSLPIRLLKASNKLLRVVFKNTLKSNHALILAAIAVLSVLIFGSFGLLKLDQAAGTNNQALLSKWSAAQDWPLAAPKFFKIVALGHNIGFAVYSEDQPKDESIEQLAVYLADRTQASESLHETVFRLESKGQQGTTLKAQYRLYLQNQPVSDYNFEWAFDHQKNNFVWLRGSPNDALPFAFSGPVSQSAQESNIETDKKQQTQKDLQTIASSKFFFPFSRKLEEALNDVSSRQDQQTKVFIVDPLRATVQAFTNSRQSVSHAQAGAHRAQPITLMLQNSLEVEFVPAAQTDLEALSATLSTEAVALNLFSSPQTETKDLVKLEATARGCMEYQSEFQERIVRNLANIPYLLHRNAWILREVCNGAADLAEGFRQKKDRDSRAQLFNQKIRTTLAGHNQEIPRSMIRSPLWPILFDDQKQALWVNSLRILIEEAELEQADLVKFEEERKVPIKMQVVLSGRTLGTVVKGVIKNIKLNMDIQVEGSQEGNMLAESWTELPNIQTIEVESKVPETKARKKSKKKGRAETEPQQTITKTSASSTVPFQLFNGRIVTEAVLSKINLVCQAFEGQAGIDLGNGPQAAASYGAQNQAPQAWGAWDSNSRLLLLERFLRKSLAQKSCAVIKVRVPAELKVPADKLVAAFESQIIQNMQEIQLTNSKYRYLTLVPGSYELYVNSLVSGEFLERFEFNVLDTGGLSTRTAKLPQDFTLRLTNSTSAKVSEPNNTP